MNIIIMFVFILSIGHVFVIRLTVEGMLLKIPVVQVFFVMLLFLTLTVTVLETNWRRYW